MLCLFFGYYLHLTSKSSLLPRGADLAADQRRSEGGSTAVLTKRSTTKEPGEAFRVVKD